MYFIYKKTLEKISSLSCEEISILKNPPKEDSLQKENLIEKLESYHKKAWILCDCKGEKPLLIIYEKYEIISVRCYRREGHLSNCIFFKKGINLKTSIYLPNRPKTFALYSNSEEKTLSLATNQNLSNQQNFKKLGAVLYAFLDEAQVNIRNPHLEQNIGTSKEISIQLKEQQFNIIWENCRNKIVFKNISLHDYLVRWWSNKSIQRAQYILSKSLWPSHLKPFCLCLRITFKLGQYNYSAPPLVNLKKVTIKNKISLPSPWIKRESSEPYLVLMTILLDNNKQIYFEDAFALPILSKTEIMPVESNYERTVLKKILKVVREFININIEIKKPLFCLRTEENKQYRPDFILTLKNNYKIFIEVLGSTNKDYLDKKTSIKEIALPYCSNYITVSAFKGQKEIEKFTLELREAISNLL